MQFGVFIFNTDDTMNIVELARAAEERGFESLWVPEHSHIPTSRRTPYPRGGNLPPEYSRIVDPFVSLGAAAAATSRLLLGTSVCLVNERDPIILAKEVASLDYLSGGRFLFGIGGGWNREEMENHGINPRRRFPILRERILALKQIWTQDEAEFHGEFVSFDPIWQWPKPVQKPHPPILVGGDAPGTLPRVVEYGDGWMPSGSSPTRLGQRIPELQRLAEEAGRPSIPVTAFNIPADAGREVIANYLEVGVVRVVFWLPVAGAEKVLPALDRLAKLGAEFA